MRGEHSEWFLDRIKKSANEPFMVYVQNNDIVAFVRFDAIEQRNYEVSVILNPIFRGKRFSKTLLLDAIDYLSRNNSAEEVVATIHRDNQPSIALFSSLGFSTTQIIEGNFIQMRKLLSLKEFKN